MPRGGWTLAHEVFRTKFQANMPILDFKKQARDFIVSKNKRPCSIKEYLRDPAKRHKAEEAQPDQQSLEEMKEKFKIKMQEISNFNVGEVERTKKIPSTKVDRAILNALNRVAAKRWLISQGSCRLSRSVTRMLPPEWKASIENKIQRMSASIALLQKSAQAELSKEERKAGKKVMRDFGLVLIKPKDVTKAISMLEESVQVKLQVHESRREFRRENQFFELNRRSFYRQLTEGGKTPHLMK